ncbi:MAG: hypothetical protein V1731_03295 [Candidatus Aenigmatarchaeota archaeon]
MSNTYLWNFLIFSSFSLTIAYIAASFFILKYVYGIKRRKERSISWFGLVAAIAIIGISNMAEAIYHSYNALNMNITGINFLILDDATSRFLVFIALVSKYYGALLLIFVALLLARDAQRRTL